MASKKSSFSEDTGHWESARAKEKAMKAPRSSGIYVQPNKMKAKKISVSDSGKTAKMLANNKATRKKVSGK